jgi:hypothetical protein
MLVRLIESSESAVKSLPHTIWHRSGFFRKASNHSGDIDNLLVEFAPIAALCTVREVVIELFSDRRSEVVFYILAQHLVEVLTRELMLFEDKKFIFTQLAHNYLSLSSSSYSTEEQ